MRILLAFTLLIATSFAHADIRWETVIGFSNRLQWGINNNQGVTLLGGMGGDDAACIGDTNNPCNTCTNVLGAICNEKRIYPTLNLRFSFASTEAIGRPVINSLNTTTPTIGDSIGNQTPSILLTTATNQLVTVLVPWSAICDKMGDPTCKLTAKSQQFRLGIDVGNDGQLSDADDFVTITIVVHNPDPAFADASSSNGGLYNFSLYPGDEKAYVQNVQLTAAQRPIQRVHFYCQTTDYASITGSDRCATIEVLNNQLVDDMIQGLPNGVKRFFYAQSEDDAGNQGLLMDDQDNNCPADSTINGNCRAVTPSAVGGLFKDNCFIATAAYGSKFEPHVKTLRSFRDKYLMPYSLGKSFVKFYYRVSPQVADWIAQSESRRAATRIGLTPVVIAVGAFMAAPLACSIGFGFFAIFMAVFIFRRQSLQLTRSRGSR